MHVGFVQRLLELQFGFRGMPCCRQVLHYDPRQKFNVGYVPASSCRLLVLTDKRSTVRSALVSIQQLHTRGNVDLKDGCPTFNAFTCLVRLGHYPYLRSIVSYAPNFICLICATSRKRSGKHDRGRRQRYHPHVL